MRKPGYGMRGKTRGFCLRHPLFVAAVVVAGCVALANVHPGWGLLAGGVLGAAGILTVGWRTGLAWLLCGWLAVAGLAWRDASRQAAERELTGMPGCWVRARLLSDGQGRGLGWAAPARLLEGGRVGADVLWEGRGEAPVAGAVVAARGNFGPLPVPRNPGEFDWATWLKNLGVAAVFQAQWQETVTTGWWAELGAKIRHGFRDRMTAGLAEDSEEAIVIRAVVIGEKPPDADTLIAAFRNSGTLYVFRWPDCMSRWSDPSAGSCSVGSACPGGGRWSPCCPWFSVMPGSPATTRRRCVPRGWQRCSWGPSCSAVGPIC